MYLLWLLVLFINFYLSWYFVISTDVSRKDSESGY